jgi:hypothetical protein
MKEFDHKKCCTARCDPVIVIPNSSPNFSESPLEGVNLTFTRFNKANSFVFFLYIAGFTGRVFFNIRKEKNQDISEKFLKIPDR